MNEDVCAVEPWDGSDAASLMQLDRIDANLFRNRFSEVTPIDHLYGGQVLAQALAAAMQTVEGQEVHSLHGYFLRAGSASRHVVFQVERLRDGGRFSTRRVVASQGGAPILDMECSFHSAEPSAFDHPLKTPHDIGPTQSSSQAQMFTDRDYSELPRRRLIDLRLVDRKHADVQRVDARQQTWMRMPTAAAIDDPRMHQLLLTYMSDYWFAGVALGLYPTTATWKKMFIASLDHALWFHRPVRVDDWLLYDIDCPSAANATVFSRGSLWGVGGQLVASSAQEALFRPR